MTTTSRPAWADTLDLPADPDAAGTDTTAGGPEPEVDRAVDRRLTPYYPYRSRVHRWLNIIYYRLPELLSATGAVIAAVLAAVYGAPWVVWVAFLAVAAVTVVLTAVAQIRQTAELRDAMRVEVARTRQRRKGAASDEGQS